MRKCLVAEDPFDHFWAYFDFWKSCMFFYMPHKFLVIGKNIFLPIFMSKICVTRSKAHHTARRQGDQ